MMMMVMTMMYCPWIHSIERTDVIFHTLSSPPDTNFLMAFPNLEAFKKQTVNQLIDQSSILNLYF